MATSALAIGTGSGGVGRADVTLKGVLTLLSSNDALDYTLTNANSPAYLQPKNLVNGANTVTVDSKAGGVLIVPPLMSTWVLTLKGVAGDTGIALAKLAPSFLAFGTTPPASFVLNWAGPSYSATAVTADNATNLITLASHGLVAGDRVKFSAATMPTGLDSTVWYYVVSPLTNTFGVALTDGGTAVDFSTNGASVTIETVREARFLWV
jgi:hypothetical protein